jgi:hypothetical protein
MAHQPEPGPHRLLVAIEDADGLFECSIEEPDAETPRFVMRGPPREYRDAVEELVESLRAHLLATPE